jgi:spore germination cell wall hydrolase CwlJ-like protein
VPLFFQGEKMKFLNKTLFIILSLSLIVTNAKPAPSITEAVRDDFNKQVLCMAKNLYYEAAMEPYEGKLAVAQVVMNRTQNKNFPADICGVVYQKTNGTCQFTWTCEKAYTVRNEYAWEESVMIARKALTEGILHKEIAKAKIIFYHATYVHPGWTNIRPFKTIGNHIFYAKA